MHPAKPARRPPRPHAAALLSPAPCLRVPAEVFAAVRTDAAGCAVRAFGPFTGAAEAAAFVAETLGGNGHVIPFELFFRRP